MNAWLSVLLWFALLYGLGFAGAGLVGYLRPELPDRGLGGGRVLAWLLWGWLYWYVPAATPLPASTSWALFTLVAVSLAGAWGWRRSGEIGFPRSAVIADALIFWLTALIFLAVRGWMADISGSEQIPDYMILHSLLRAEHFPPEDVWFAGATLRYYYLSHLLFVPLAKICFLPGAVIFNLALSSVMPLFASALATPLMQSSPSRRRGGVWIGTALFLGNLATIVLLLATPTFDYYAASRVIPETINEFPLFSFFVGDLHAHFVSLPITVLTAWLACQWVSGAGGRNMTSAALVGLLIGVHGGLNSWAVPALLLLVAVLWISFAWRSESWKVVGRRALREVGGMALAGGLAASPYFLQQRGPALAFAWVPSGQHSPLGMFFIHWGALLLPLAWLAIGEWKRQPRLVQIAALLAAAALALCQLATLAGLSLLLAAVVFRQRRERESGPWSLAATALLLLLGCEWFYFSESYAFHLPLLRANTVFKFHYLAWGFLLLLLPRLMDLLEPWPRRLCWGVIGLGMLYFPAALVGRPMTTIWTLDGQYWFKVEAAEAWQAVIWLSEHARPGERIVEPTTMSQQGYNLISAFSGQPALLGWVGHEGIWRGSDDLPQIIQRRRDIAEIYQTSDPARLRQLLDVYAVAYVLWNDQVRLLYRVSTPRALAALPRVLQAGGVSLFSAQGSPPSPLRQSDAAAP